MPSDDIAVDRLLTNFKTNDEEWVPDIVLIEQQMRGATSLVMTVLTSRHALEGVGTVPRIWMMLLWRRR